MSPSTPTPNANIQTTQPNMKQSMSHVPSDNAQSAQKDIEAQQESETTHLRGGEACPGRFCFIIPCPIPCNFCVFPCPC